MRALHEEPNPYSAKSLKNSITSLSLSSTRTLRSFRFSLSPPQRRRRRRSGKEKNERASERARERTSRKCERNRRTNEFSLLSLSLSLLYIRIYKKKRAVHRTASERAQRERKTLVRQDCERALFFASSSSSSSSSSMRACSAERRRRRCSTAWFGRVHNVASGECVNFRVSGVF